MESVTTRRRGLIPLVFVTILGLILLWQFLKISQSTKPNPKFELSKDDYDESDTEVKFYDEPYIN